MPTRNQQKTPRKKTKVKINKFHVEDVFVGKTFDDFSVYPLGGVASRSNISLRTKFSRNITLNLPLVAANMDTVTGPAMCIAIARAGGIGILPRSNAISIEQQAGWVRETKRAENFIISDPYTVKENQTVGEARIEMQKKGVGTLLVTNSNGKLVGMIDRRDIQLCFNDSEMVRDWMIKRVGGRLAFSRAEINSQESAVSELLRHKVSKLPLVGKNFVIKGLITAKDLMSLKKNTWANKDKKGRLRVGAAIGATGDYLERAAELIRVGVDVIVMDVAHAHNEKIMGAAIENFRRKFGDFELVCGNVATFEGAKFLMDKGVDGVKVGLGSGHGCRTRIETGVGVPQVMAVRAAWQAVKNSGIPIISDGGIKRDGHIAIALNVGADSVMVGSLLSGTDEAPGVLIKDPSTGAPFKIYRGMTAPETKLEGVGSAAKIRNIEGQTQKVSYIGSAVDIFQRIKEHLQSMVSYIGEKSLESAKRKISENPLKFFILLSESSKKESFQR